MTQPAPGVSARADFVAALAWIAFGLAIIAGSLAMDRLERFGATVYTAPGLVPGLLGGLIALFLYTGGESFNIPDLTARVANDPIPLDVQGPIALTLLIGFGALVSLSSTLVALTALQSQGRMGTFPRPRW